MRYEKVGSPYQPDVVIFGFYPRGFFRLCSRFRFYAKPYFVLDESGELRLENVPVMSPDELYAAYVEGRRRIGGWRHSYLLGTLGGRVARSLERKRIGDVQHKSWALMAAVLRRFQNQAVGAGSQPFLLIFPVRPGKYKDRVYEDLDRLAQEEARRLGIPFIALSQRFLAALEQSPDKALFREPDVGGHLSVEGHRLVARLLYDSLKEQGVLVPK